MKKSLAHYAVAAAVATVCFAPAISQAAAPSANGNFATVVIGDIHGFTDQGAMIAEQISPMFNGDMIRQQLGALIEDPKLEAMPKGSGLAVVITNGSEINGFVEVASGKADAVLTSIKAKMPNAEKVSDTLIGFSQANQVNDASKEVAAKLLEGDGKASIVGAVFGQEIYKAFGPKMESQIKEGLAKSDDEVSSATKQFIPWMVYAYTDMLKQVDVVQLELSVSSKGIQTDWSLFPVGGVKPGTAPTKKAADLLKLIPNGSSFQATYDMDEEKLYGGLADTLKRSGEKADVDPAMVSAVVQLLTDLGAAIDGSFAQVNDVTEDGMSGASVAVVKDEAKLLSLLDLYANPDKNAAIKVLTDAMQSSATVKFTKDAREHAGVKIHVLEVNTPADEDIETGAPKADALIKSMQNQRTELAIVNGLLVTAANKQKIEPLIDAAKTGANANPAVISAVTTLPAGGKMYSDADFSSLTGLFQSMLTGDAAEYGKVAENFKDLPPIVSGAYSDTDRYWATTTIPLEFVNASVAAFGQVQAIQSQSATDDEDEDEGDEKEATEATPAAPSGNVE